MYETSTWAQTLLWDKSSLTVGRPFNLSFGDCQINNCPCASNPSSPMRLLWWKIDFVDCYGITDSLRQLGWPSHYQALISAVTMDNTQLGRTGSIHSWVHFDLEGINYGRGMIIPITACQDGEKTHWLTDVKCLWVIFKTENLFVNLLVEQSLSWNEMLLTDTTVSELVIWHENRSDEENAIRAQNTEWLHQGTHLKSSAQEGESTHNAGQMSLTQ